MSKRLDQKIALITGAADGIGRGCAEAFIREGARVIVGDRNVESGLAVAHQIVAAGGDATFLEVDIAEATQVEALLQHVSTQYGRLDVLLCSAGVGGRSLGDGPVDVCTVEAWDQVFQINLRGTFLTCKYALPLLLAARGCIITISSVLGMVGTQGLFDTHAYATSKAGVIGLTRTIAAHYASQGVRANTIAPGLVDTRMARRTRADPALLEQVGMWQPLGPLGNVDDVTATAVFLASDESRFITGVVLPVDGGWTVQ